MKFDANDTINKLKVLDNRTRILTNRLPNKPTRVFTCLCHGTNTSRDGILSTDDYKTILKADDELVSVMAKYIKGTEAKPVVAKKGDSTAPWKEQYLVLEGPGSILKGKDGKKAMPGISNPLVGGSGTYVAKDSLTKANPFTTDNKKSKKSGRAFHEDFYGNTTEKPKDKLGGKIKSGSAQGEGWGDNVYRAVACIVNAQPHVVNLVGWSRGAVTCLRIANRLYSIMGTEIEVNIFACDPVIGKMSGAYSTKQDLGMTTIPPNVVSYLAVLAQDEFRENFRCVARNWLYLYNSEKYSPKLPEPMVHFLVLPGNHSDIAWAKPTASMDPVAVGAAKIARDLAYKFLLLHGTSFKPFDKKVTYMGLSKKEINTLYKKIYNKGNLDRHYMATTKAGLGSGSVFKEHRGFYPKSKRDKNYYPTGYQNAHHKYSDNPSAKQPKQLKQFYSHFDLGSAVNKSDEGKVVEALNDLARCYGFRLSTNSIAQLVDNKGKEIKGSRVKLSDRMKGQTPLIKILPNMF